MDYNRHEAKDIADFIKKSIIYQISLRCFTPEGTLAAAEKKLGEIADIGVTDLYLMPITEHDSDSDLSHWTPRQKASGCNNAKNPYRLSDYYKIDPEYGTVGDLKSFVKRAHELGMRVILDLVYYHAGPTFAKRHPTFVLRNEDGSPKDGDWAFPLLDYTNQELREHLWQNMEYFVREIDVDGYRCDVGDRVPVDFWEEGRRRIEAIKGDVVMICEGVRYEDQLKAFDLSYTWALTVMPDCILCGKRPASDLARVISDSELALPRNPHVLRFFDNHDIINDRYDRPFEALYGSAAVEAMLAVNYLLDGVPLIYNGYEVKSTARNSIYANKGQYVIKANPDCEERKALLRRLAALRRDEAAIYAGSITFILTNVSNEVLSFIREYKDERILVTVNLSQHYIKDVWHAITLECKPKTLLSSHAEREAITLKCVNGNRSIIKMEPYGIIVEKL